MHSCMNLLHSWIYLKLYLFTIFMVGIINLNFFTSGPNWIFTVFQLEMYIMLNIKYGSSETREWKQNFTEFRNAISYIYSSTFWVNQIFVVHDWGFSCGWGYSVCWCCFCCWGLSVLCAFYCVHNSTQKNVMMMVERTLKVCHLLFCGILTSEHLENWKGLCFELLFVGHFFIQLQKYWSDE